MADSGGLPVLNLLSRLPRHDVLFSDITLDLYARVCVQSAAAALGEEIRHMWASPNLPIFFGGPRIKESQNLEVYMGPLLMETKMRTTKKGTSAHYKSPKA